MITKFKIIDNEQLRKAYNNWHKVNLVIHNDTLATLSTFRYPVRTWWGTKKYLKYDEAMLKYSSIWEWSKQEKVNQCFRQELINKNKYYAPYKNNSLSKFQSAVKGDVAVEVWVDVADLDKINFWYNFEFEDN